MNLAGRSDDHLNETLRVDNPSYQWTRVDIHNLQTDLKLMPLVIIIWIKCINTILEKQRGKIKFRIFVVCIGLEMIRGEITISITIFNATI